MFFGDGRKMEKAEETLDELQDERVSVGPSFSVKTFMALFDSKYKGNNIGY